MAEILGGEKENYYGLVDAYVFNSLNDMIEFVHNMLSHLIEIKLNFSASFALQSKPLILSTMVSRAVMAISG